MKTHSCFITIFPHGYTENMHLPGLSVLFTQRCKKDELGWDTKVYIDQTAAIHFSRQARQDSWPRSFFKFGFDDSTPGTFYDCILNALETTRLAHSVLESELVRFFVFLFFLLQLFL